MIKNLKNYLFLLTITGYLLFLILRVILERNPIDPILLTGAFIFFPLVLWVCLFLFLLFIKIYKLVVPSALSSSSSPSYFVHIGLKTIYQKFSRKRKNKIFGSIFNKIVCF